MKKAITLFTISSLPLISLAQIARDTYQREFDMTIFNVCATIFVVGLFMVFILTVMKRILEHRIKNKIVDKGISENLASALLESEPLDRGNVNIRWFSILAGLGTALAIIKYTEPLGIHSLAIMAFCIAGSFLGYYFFSKSAAK